MEHRLPLEPGKIYHVYNRRNRKDRLFYHDSDYRRFLSGMRKYLVPIGTIYAYAVMPNHFHVLLSIHATVDLPDFYHDPVRIARCFGHWQNSYAKYVNTKYDTVGNVFQHRFQRKLVVSDENFRNLLCYIHLNPEKHGFAHRTEYPYTSYFDYAEPRGPDTDQPIVRTGRAIQLFGGLKKLLAAHG